MKTNAKPTNTPTMIKADLAVIPNDGMVIELTANDGAETIGYATSEKNAAFIVRVANHYEGMIELLRKFYNDGGANANIKGQVEEAFKAAGEVL